MSSRRVWLPLFLVATLLIGVAGGVFAAQNFDSGNDSQDEVAVMPLSVPDASSTTSTTSAPTTTTTTAPITTTTTTTVPEEPAFDFSVFQRAYDEGYGFGYQFGLVSGEIPPEVSDMYTSDDPHDFGYAAGYIDGWQVAVAVAAAEQSQPVAAPAPAAAPAPVAAPATTTTTIPDNTQWCLDYKLQLEIAGDERARSTPVSPTSDGTYFSMNRGMYKEWVVKPLADAGCPIPPGYPAP